MDLKKTLILPKQLLKLKLIIIGTVLVLICWRRSRFKKVFFKLNYSSLVTMNYWLSCNGVLRAGRLEFDQTNLPYYTEIDAVALLGKTVVDNIFL